MQVLQLNNGHIFDLPITEVPEFVRRQLGKFLGNGYNGFAGGGTAWLPYQPLSDEANGWLIDHHFGSMSEVKFANDQAVAGLSGLVLGENWAEDENLIDVLCAIAGEASPNGWAHFGPFGTGDSLWVLAQ